MNLEVSPLCCIPDKSHVNIHCLQLHISIFFVELRIDASCAHILSSAHKHALFFWLSAKVKAKIVLAEEFWALSRIPPPPLLAQYDGPSADKTCRKASGYISTQLLSRLATPIFSQYLASHLLRLLTWHLNKSPSCASLGHLVSCLHCLSECASVNL